jgi:hypothetical protein
VDGNRERRRAECHAEQDRHEHEAGSPSDVARQLDGPHAGVVHAGDAAADDRTRDRPAPAFRNVHRDTETRPGDDRGSEQRQRRQAEVVGNGEAGLIRQHRDEVRGPDAAARRNGVERHPSHPRTALRGTGAVKQADGNGACQHADRAAKRD